MTGDNDNKTLPDVTTEHAHGRQNGSVGQCVLYTATGDNYHLKQNSLLALSIFSLLMLMVIPMGYFFPIPDNITTPLKNTTTTTPPPPPKERSIFSKAYGIPIKSLQGIGEVIKYDEQKHCASDTAKRPSSLEYLNNFNCGHVVDIDGTAKQATRNYTLIVDEDHLIPITEKGQIFRGWTYNGTIPGPTLRMTEGDQIHITLINANTSQHSHSLHMHSIHNGTMDGVTGPSSSIAPGHNFTYSFIAQPFGVYPYHCHVDPIADHINRGLYGMMIIDPKEPRVPMHEMVMLMNGYDLDYDQEGPVKIPEVNSTDKTKFIAREGEDEEERSNEIYTVNGKAFDYVNHPIQLIKGDDYRIYLVNMLEFDLINSFHLHGMMFGYIPSGTSQNWPSINDIVTLGQGDRGILEFKAAYPGNFMFHAHVGEFGDKGWMGMFNTK